MCTSALTMKTSTADRRTGSQSEPRLTMGPPMRMEGVVDGDKLLPWLLVRDSPGRSYEDRDAPETSARPIVLLSVPNQICPPRASNIMCRTVPPPLGMGVTPKNFWVFGSNPTSRLGCEPVSTSQIRSLSSDAMA